MKKYMFLLFVLLPALALAQNPPADTYPTSAGELRIMPIGHGSLMMQFGGKTIHVDPYSSAGDYGDYTPADLVLITHDHGDHFDVYALQTISTPDTYVVANKSVANQYDKVNAVLANGESTEWNGISIQAVPAYNIVHEREPGQPYHPKGDGNGYVLTFGDFRLYIAGDTEPIPEMRDLGRIDVAFLPKNLPYTMSDEEFVEAARLVNPRVLYPYHYTRANKTALREQLPDLILK